jgi:hypothetical protein
MFPESRVLISAMRPSTLTDIFSRFLQSFQKIFSKFSESFAFVYFHKIHNSILINHLNTKNNLIYTYIKNRFVSRSKHTPYQS